MITVHDWFEREFNFDFPVTMFPMIVERLRGTPSRLQDRVGSLRRDVLIRRDGDDWSIQEHAGHLLDMRGLDNVRLEDFKAGRDVLTAADLNNLATYEANHNADAIEDILSRFRTERLKLVLELEGLDETMVAQTALHPRLQTPMRLVDWCFFVAEHDDHHLAQISDLLRKFS
jgi:hypothetical protein